MDIALTTRWNAGRHITGEAMIEEILELGFNHVELGYDLRLNLAAGVEKMVAEKAITVNSVHNFCPVPMGSPRGHPEIYVLGSLDERVRKGAAYHTAKTIEFAASVGAKVMVVHAGYVKTRKSTNNMIDLIMKDKQCTPAYEKLKMKFENQRDKKAPKVLSYLYEGIERLLPVCEEHKVVMAFENLPTWEALPTESEMLQLVQHFNSPWLKYWHDLGHGQIRENLGFIDAEHWLDQLQEHLAGMHLHDVAPPIYDHTMPPRGHMDFQRFKRFAQMDIVRVIEPTPRTPAEEIVEAHRFLKEAWADDEEEISSEPSN